MAAVLTGQGKITSGSRAYVTAIIALFFGSLAAFGIEYCVQPIIPVFTKTFGISPATASLAVSFGTGGMACAMLAIAGLAQRLPRKKAMGVALVGSALLALVMATSESFGLILGLRLCQGVLLACFPAMAIAYITEEFELAIVGTVVGIYVSGTSVGGLVGRLTLSFLTDLWGWRFALAGLSFLYVAIGIVFVCLLPRPRHQLAAREQGSSKADFKHLFTNGRLLCVYGIALCAMGGFVCVYNFISYVLLAPPYNLSQTLIGLVYLLYFVGTFSSTVMGRLADRIGNGPVICLSLLCMLLGGWLSLAVLLPVKLLGIGLFTYGFFGAHSAACSWSGRLDKSDKARISALYMFFYYVGASVIGSAGGFFLARWGWPGIVGFLSLVLLCALGLACWLMHMERVNLLAACRQLWPKA